MTQLEAFVDGIAFWTPSVPNWDVAHQAFSDLSSENKQDQPAQNSPIPLPGMLPPAERRRAPETVSLALEVARQAIAMWGGHPAELLSVFTSTSGDTPIIDYLCNTLVSSPQLISPTRFLHSIHNAPAGVWSMATLNAQANTSLSAHHFSFSNGLLEAVVQCQTEQKPVLLVGYDTKAPSALSAEHEDPIPMAVALIFSAQSSPSTQGVLRCTIRPNQDPQTIPQTVCSQQLMASGMAQALPLLEALALSKNTQLNLMLSAHQTFVVHYEPVINPFTDRSPITTNEFS
jgi:hypothetical protein